jgi:tRNA threonylcarbamoyl adenosine modification protein YeaZ
MLLIALDTALGASSVAVLDTATDAILASRSEPMDRGHAERLLPLVAEVLAEAGVAARDCRRFVTTIGPGSFTGLRVAIAAARGMALAAGGDSVGISTLQALSFGAGGAVLACIDARHGHIYAALTGPGGEALLPASYVPTAEAARLASEQGAMVCGPGAAVILAAWPEAAGPACAVDPCSFPDIAVIARMGAAADASLSPAKPLYLKAVDAKLPAPRVPIAQFHVLRQKVTP